MKANIILSIPIPTCLCKFSSEMFFTMNHFHWFSKNDNFRNSLGWVCEFLCKNGDNGYDGKLKGLNDQKEACGRGFWKVWPVQLPDWMVLTL